LHQLLAQQLQLALLAVGVAQLLLRKQEAYGMQAVA
jgi:hypothetical protein